jgi:hypothetical protein
MDLEGVAAERIGAPKGCRVTLCLVVTMQEEQEAAGLGFELRLTGSTSASFRTFVVDHRHSEIRLHEPKSRS